MNNMVIRAKKSISKTILLCSSFVWMCGFAHAGSQVSHYLRPNVSDWTNVKNYYNTITEPPAAGDLIWNCKSYTNYVSYGTASWGVFQHISQFTFQKDEGTLVITIPEGVCATNVTLLGSSNTAEVFENCGTVVKRGKGTLVYYNTGSVFKGASCAFLTKNLRIEEGELRLPQDVDTSYRLGNVYVAEGSTFTLARRAEGETTSLDKATTYLASLSGSGLVTNTTAHGVPLIFDRPFTNDFTGAMGGGIYLQIKADHTDFNLTNAENTFSDAEKSGNGFNIAANDTCIGMTTFGAMDEAYPSVPSSSGYSSRFTIAGRNVTLRNLNTEKQVCGKTMILNYSPLILDAGTYGGITYTNWISGSYGSKKTVSRMHHLILDGDNTEPCVFSPVIRCWSMDCEPPTNCTLYITKRGTGTYRFLGVTKHRAGTSDWRGALAVENGVVTFDSVAEAGINSSLGQATILQEPYCDVYDPKHDVNYAITLGGLGTKGTLTYCGTTAAKTTTRPIAIYSDGALVNDSTQPLEWSGVSPRTDSSLTKTFRLGGSSTAANVCSDITGTLSLVKEGTGTWYISGDTSFTGDVTVKGGKLVVQGGVYTYYKWVAMQCWGVEIDPSTGVERSKGSAYGLHLQEFALFDEDGLRVNTGLTMAADLASIGPGEAAFTDAGKGYTYTKGTTAEDNLPKIFNDSVDNSWWWMPQGTVKIGLPITHLSLTMHLPPESASVASYDLVTSDEVGSYPSRWKLYGSYDGAQWMLLDDKTSEAQEPPRDADGAYLKNYWSNKDGSGNYLAYTAGSATSSHTTGFSIVQPKQTFTNVQNVRVAAGAELVAEGTALISHLTIDATDGGDIKGFTFAENGELDVVNAGHIRTALTLPGNFGSCNGFQNIKNWTVRVDGKTISSKRIVVEDGRVTIKAKGFLIIYHQ